jgi:hypothetical protein
MKDSLAAALETVAVSGMPEIIEYAFATPLGIVDLLAELSIRDNTVVLSEICIYSRDAASIPRGLILAELIDQRQRLFVAIRDLGWREVEMSGRRVLSSSANPGKHVRLIRRFEP